MIVFNSNVLKFSGFWLGFGSSPTPPPTPTIYHITVPTVEHGTVSVNPTEGPTGTLVTISTTPDTGYELDTISLTGAALINGNQFYIDGSDVTVNVTFKSQTTSDVLYKGDGSEHGSDWSTSLNMNTNRRYISMIIGMRFEDSYVGTINFNGDGKTIKFGHFGWGESGNGMYNANMLKLDSGVSSFTFNYSPPHHTQLAGYANVAENGSSGVYSQPDIYNIIFDTVNNTMAIYMLDTSYDFRSPIDIPNTPDALRGTAQLTFNPKLINEITVLAGNGEPYHHITYRCFLKNLSVKAFDNFNDALAFKGEYSA